MTPYNFVDLADAPTAVFWVTNCCPVPADLHFIHVLRNIKRCLYESSYNGRVKFMVYDSTSPSLINENPPVENLVITRFPEGGDPFEKFKKIFVDIMEWSIDNPTPANILYISGDMNTYMTRLINQLGVVCYNTLLCVRESLTAFPTTGGRPFITRDFSFVSSVWSWFELSHGRPPFFNRFSDKPSVPLGLLKEEEKVTKAKEGARGSC
ncbi:hypothetical protein HID58_065801 [Brassica napus]|uniref:NYN domain-containing protein n=1 Tax=Brassica napus TaxID=3708 RepID=A0ABQ7ZEB1_BRANA|nr:uncharacterized protein LOC106399402 isoform X1 [Brassica napus]KAH0878407.1 hypothetical protein HID58_065801 [Brassica napus]